MVSETLAKARQVLSLPCAQVRCPTANFTNPIGMCILEYAGWGTLIKYAEDCHELPSPEKALEEGAKGPVDLKNVSSGCFGRPG